MGRRALEGVKVVEYSQLISGPYCAKMMADMGAEVIKVEEPGVGDDARRRGPFLDDIPGPERSGLFLYLNTNKLSVTLNLKSPSGRNIFLRLVEDADILVENYPSNFLKDLQLDYDCLREVNPRLILTSITPFGQSGPYKNYRAYNLNLYHIGGLGYPGGTPDPNTTPLKAGGSQAEFIAATAGAVGAMSALHYQRATGKGQHVDVAAMEAMAGIYERMIQMYTRHGIEIRRLGRPNIGSGTLLPCKDGKTYFVLPEEAHWHRFVAVMGNPEWAKSDKFQDRDGRTRNRKELELLVGKWMIERTRDEIIRVCQANRVPFAPLNDMADLANSEHLAARDYFAEIEHPEAGLLRYPSASYKYEKTPWQVRRPAPLLGQHNEQVYCGRLGYSRDELTKLAQTGVI
ncbi:MAG: CoA transferase [Dehalococcoidia bacterium]|nr:CoA transferase [Dehalococcoidia bacterium]